jgi:[acyl-carrier-protein] S-malonyltransferase
MGRAFYETSAAAKAVFEEADAVLGIHLTRLVFEGPESELALTAKTQPAVLTASVAAAAACAERGLQPALGAGHSLGEYSALVVAGALSFADAVRVVRKRGEFMQDAVPVGTGAMAAVMGLDVEAVADVCREAAAGDVVEVANINSAGQIVIAGHRGAVERAVKLAAARGGRKSTLLPVSAPFHSSLMAPAAERLAAELDAVAVRDPSFPVARNVDGELTRSARDVKPFLLRQVASPVRWTDCVRRLSAEGATAFVEVGPGRVLTGLLRRILDGARGYSIEDPDGLEKTLAALGARV